MKRNRKQRKALKASNLDLFTETYRTASIGSPDDTPKLPDRDELAIMFADFNRKYFHGRLPSVSIEWSTRMLVAGKYYIDKKLIRLGRKYHECYPDEIEDTLKHEMLHILYPDHGPRFKREAARIGTSNHAREYPAGKSPHKYIYICPVCGQRFYRHKRLHMASCGDCSKGRYNPRFKLKLYWSAPKNGGKK